MILFLWALGVANAADHIDAPIAAADSSADLSDLFAWHSGNQFVAAINFAGLSLPGDPNAYDADVLYGLHIDNDGDSVADVDVWIRFGQDGLGNWGVQVEGIPGTGAPVVGPVESVIAVPGGQVFAGLRDDPFAFDFTGFNDTLATGTLAFDATRDDFAGTNVTSIVLEMDLGAASNGSTSLNVWASSHRAQ